MADHYSAPCEQAREFDLSLVAQRILKLSDICVLEHLEAVARSQAVGISRILGDDASNAETPTSSANRLIVPDFTN